MLNFFADGSVSAAMNATDSVPILELLPGHYAVCRIGPAGEDIFRRFEEWTRERTGLPRLISLSSSDSELSLVLPVEEISRFTSGLSGSVGIEGGFRALRVAGVLDFSLVGVLSSLLLPLSACGISVFTVSTFETDYILIREGDLGAAVSALRSMSVIRDLGAGGRTPSSESGKGAGRNVSGGGLSGRTAADGLVPGSSSASSVGTVPFSGRPSGSRDRRIVLRSFRERDVIPLLRWVEDPRTARSWGGPGVPIPVTAERLLNEWSRRKEAGSGGSRSLWFVGFAAGYTAAEGNIVGYGQILDIDSAAGAARLGGLIVDPALRGEGLGVELVEELLEVCFGDLGLRRASLRVYRWNKSALFCYLAAGLRVEGIIPDALEFEGESWDTVLLGCRAAEYAFRPHDRGH